MVEKYDKSSVDSIVNFANLITGKSLKQVPWFPYLDENIRNRGELGKMVEDHFFQHSPANNGDPDFAEAGLELKTTGVLKNSKGVFKAKERLVLTMINYLKIVDESWDESTLLHKCQLMLILFYLYDKKKPVYEQKFILPPLLLDFPGEDLEVIRKDWKTIQAKIAEGKAHELSEGDTFYLAACRKGSGGPNEKLMRQPNSEILAKSRAFSLKPSYITTILQGHVDSIPTMGDDSELSIEEQTSLKFRPFIGKTIEEICAELNYFKTNPNQKSFNKSISNRILSGSGSEPLELKKAGIQMKTIRLTKTGKLKESMSFRGFKYLEIVNEEWEHSTFASELEQKFLFVIFQIGMDGKERLKKVAYWNMPYADREEAREVWEKTRDTTKYDAKILPKSSESSVAHVRPKAKNKKDTIETPQGEQLVKKGFWLNRGYVLNVINSL